MFKQVNISLGRENCPGDEKKQKTKLEIGCNRCHNGIVHFIGFLAKILSLKHVLNKEEM